MEASRLQLETYHLTKVSIQPRESVEAIPLGQFADFSNAEMSSQVSLHGLDSESEEKKLGLELVLSIKPKDGTSFPYLVDLGIIGVFDATQLPEERRDSLVLVNGASILYSSLREVLLTLSYRCIHGPVMLPSVHFANIAADYEAQNSDARNENT